MTDNNLVADLAALVDRPRYRPGPPCGVSIVLTKVAEANPEAGAMIRELLDNEGVSASALAELLAKHKHALSAQSVSRHRRRGQHNGCRCDR